MNITYISGGSYLLSAERHELPACYINEELAKALVCRYLRLDTLPHGTTLEMYESFKSILIFISLTPSYYGFDNFEDVISACKCCSAEDSALYYYDGEYILFVSFPNPHFSEFSRNIPAGPKYIFFLKEHGKTIIPFNAVNFVKNTF